MCGKALAYRGTQETEGYPQGKRQRVKQAAKAAFPNRAELQVPTVCALELYLAPYPSLTGRAGSELCVTNTVANMENLRDSWSLPDS